MKDLNNLRYTLTKFQRELPKKVIEANKITAERIQNDARALMDGRGTGNYSNSIRVGETKYSKEEVSTFIGSDVTVITTGKNPGRVYNLGYLLENGTLPHAIPGAFYGYKIFPEFGDWPDFHPGFAPIPHYSIALEQNKQFYKEQIKKALKEARK